jgi:hypothetical protein
MQFIIIVRIFPPKIDCPLEIDSIILNILNIMRIIIVFDIIEIIEIMIVVVRAQDLPFKRPYAITK